MTIWDLNDLFCMRQWIFLAPVFTKEKFHHELENKSCFPFMIRHNPEGKGHYSSVCKVEIHGAHQTVFSSAGTDTTFEAALKAIEKGAGAFAQENKFLEIVRLVNHRHLISPLASLTYRPSDEGGSFLFPWAGGGNLTQAWRGEALRDGVARRRSRDLARWTMTQIHGLCDALKALHSKEGRHGDIKPENILLFHDSDSRPGTLRIADSGLGRFHSSSTSQRGRRGQKTKTSTATSRYAPPEFVINIGVQLPRSQDVWSLGCVFLEFVAWAVWGIKGLDELDRIQNFWQDNEPHKQGIIPTNKDVSSPHRRSISRSLLIMVTTSMSSVLLKTLHID
jgi:serine/threonine protein kinase